ncbi:hypothetical protein GCK72_019071 [Caenorhabditis remanei]|uniref:HORMA domain-containing protein n=1 Tax=Caenorhabditis remanei TaxID=31234 RepID=A0A6A5GCD0_CAERE|nr:hypothetical protein GCK72_019071 [Caenorhabditis remanei]KAF1752516.1 hypothetical protein GCK72_019071 [Caenorhabditis remanei]
MSSLDNTNETGDKSADSVINPKSLYFSTENPSDTVTSSRIMARAVFLAFSEILRRRAILPKDYFAKTNITKDVKCTGLRVKNPKSLTIARMLSSSGRAIKEKYLKELSLVISNEKDDKEAIEVHSMKFQYLKNGGVAAHYSTKNQKGRLTTRKRLPKIDQIGNTNNETIHDQFMGIINSIKKITKENLSPLPNDFDVNFRVQYTDNAPTDYKIDGFAHSDVFYSLPKNIQSAKIGNLRSDNHEVFLDCSSVFMKEKFFKMPICSPKSTVRKQPSSSETPSSPSLGTKFMNEL